MATETLTNALGDAPDPVHGLSGVRDRTVYEAASEAGALADIFRKIWEKEGRGSVEFECTIRGALLRIEALCTAVCMLQNESWRENLAEEHRIVFGKPLEVANA